MPSTQSEQVEQFSGLVGVGMAVTTAVAMTAVGVFALDNALYGAVAGVSVAAGNYLFVPWFIRLSAAQETDEELTFSEIAEEIGADPTKKVFGLGLELGGITMLAVGFTQEEPSLAIGAPVALAVALFVYLVGAVVFDR